MNNDADLIQNGEAHLTVWYTYRLFTWKMPDNLSLLVEEKTSAKLKENKHRSPMSQINTQQHTAKTHTENSQQIFPEKELLGPQSQFPHSCV
jgi:hypothetical protein